MSYTSTGLRTSSTISSRFLPENFHRLSHECSLEQITFVGRNWGAQSTGSLWGVYTASTRTVSGFFTADTLYTPKYFGVRYCEYSGTRRTLTAHTPSTRSIQAFGTAHTPSTRKIQAFSTAHTPSTRSKKCTRYSQYTQKYEAYWEHL